MRDVSRFINFIVWSSGRDLKLSPNFHTFIHFHPLLVHTSVKNFLYYFSIPLPFNRPVKRSRISTEVSYRFCSRLAKQKISGNKFQKCEPLSCRAFSLFWFRNEAKTWQNNRHWAQVFPVWLLFFFSLLLFSFFPPIQFREWFFTRETILKKFPILSPIRSRFIGF